MRTLILDNYDSFTFNLYQMVAELNGGERPVVLRNDAVSAAEVAALAPDRIILSPGPGSPEISEYFGICRQVILDLGPRIPILGVCLGHLGMIQALGGRIVRSPEPRHGKTSPIYHVGESIFAGLPDPFPAMRYHSLIGEQVSLPDCLELTAWTDDGLVMGIRHREWPLLGVQFHPESIGTPDGRHLVDAFLAGRF